jgi:hypothetical protein
MAASRLSSTAAGDRTAARSTSVRAGVVTGIPSTRSTSTAGSRALVGDDLLASKTSSLWDGDLETRPTGRQAVQRRGGQVGRNRIRPGGEARSEQSLAPGSGRPAEPVDASEAPLKAPGKSWLRRSQRPAAMRFRTISGDIPRATA